MSRGVRRRGREICVQLLYQLDVQDALAVPGPLIDAFFHTLADQCNPGLPKRARAFAEQTCRQLGQRIDRVDQVIRAASTRWRLERMDRVDRAVLRLGTFELLQSDGPPPAVVINEAVELAKVYGSEKSASFVNGVLSRIDRDHRKR